MSVYVHNSHWCISWHVFALIPGTPHKQRWWILVQARFILLDRLNDRQLMQISRWDNSIYASVFVCEYIFQISPLLGDNFTYICICIFEFIYKFNTQECCVCECLWGRICWEYWEKRLRMKGNIYIVYVYVYLLMYIVCWLLFGVFMRV